MPVNNSLSALTGGRNRMPGLISGLDTETLVKNMSAASKLKINMQQQKLDMLGWKQTSYRSVISKIADFQNKYLNITKPDTNLSSNYLMAAHKATSTNSSIKVTASSNSLDTSYSIEEIKQLAENAKVESSGDISSGIKLNFDDAAVDKEITLSIDIDGLKKDITFKTAAQSGDATKVDKAATIANMNASLDAAFGGVKDNINVDDKGNMTFTNDVGDKIKHNFTVDYSDKVSPIDQDQSMRAVGLSGRTSNKLTLSSKLGDINFKEGLVGGSYEFKINGESFSFNKDSSIRDIVDAVNGSKANATIEFDSLSQKFTLKSKDQGAASSLKVEQTSGNLLSSIFGSATIGKSANLSTVSMKEEYLSGEKIGSTDFEAFKNKEISITVNGVTKNIGIWGYNANGDKNNYADVYEKDEDGNNTDKLIAKGTDKLVQDLNSELKKEFGADAPSFSYNDLTGKISISGESTDSISIDATKNEDGTSVEGSDGFLAALGFGGADTKKTNDLSGTEKVYDLIGMGSVTNDSTFNVGGTDITITKETTLDELKAALGDKGTVDLKKGTISFNGKLSSSTLEGQTALKQMMGVDDYNDIANYTGEANTTAEAAGKNAIVTINGTQITNATNEISIDGTKIDISNADSKLIGEGKMTAADKVTITNTRDTEKAFDAVVKFVEDYNKLIAELNIETKTSRPTGDGSIRGTKYDPLTEEQREEMTEDQIKAWEEKGKQGLLYNDSAVNGFLTNIRSALNTIGSDNFTLNQMGIKVSNDWKDNGKLIINENQLKAAFESNPDKIQELFTSENGLMAQVSQSIDKAIGTKGGANGTLVQIAGIANTSTTSENRLSKQIDTYKSMIETMKTKYAAEQERYWTQFTNLETVMNKYNSQSSWLAEQFG
ncbi:MAG: flagellar filament capping protein FliD [Oscillospiraceae bacterium]